MSTAFGRGSVLPDVLEVFTDEEYMTSGLGCVCTTDLVTG